MKKILTIILMVILAMVTVQAQAPWETDCTDRGFDRGVAKWGCVGPDEEDASASIVLFKHWYFDEGDNEGVFVEGTCDLAEWTGYVQIDGVVSKSGQDYAIHPGGESGIIESGDHSLSHLTFCQNDDDNEIPEFGVIGAVAVLGLAGLFIHKRRN